MAAKEIQPPQTLKVLCFGASLTAGYSHHGIQFHPYAERLKLALQGALPSTSIEIVVDGLSGAQVRRQYIDRLSRACQEVKGEPYNWIIIQGGTNDLAWGGEAEAIFEALRVYLFSSTILYSFPVSVSRTCTAL
jgi:lysophospholipase L1-like esterase